MKTRWLELRSKHWNGRPVQEKRLIFLVGTLLLPVIFYFFLWQPAHSAVSKLHNLLPTMQAQSIKRVIKPPKSTHFAIVLYWLRSILLRSNQVSLIPPPDIS